MKYVVAVLPDGFGYDEGGFGMDVFEDGHALFLRSDKAVFLVLFVGVSAADCPSFALDCGSDGFFHCFLCGPAHLVGR